MNALAIFAVDRVVKFLVIEYVTNDIILIPNIFKITLQLNTGIAFSIALPQILQIILFPILITGGLYVAFKNLNVNKFFVQSSVGCVIGAAFGNFFDRVFLGRVVDYISIGSYPVFNFADLTITLGIFLLVVFYGKIRRV